MNQLVLEQILSAIIPAYSKKGAAMQRPFSISTIVV
jgi:hypothetical protein